jgi:hypothetical protein
MVVLCGCASGTTSKTALIKSAKHVESSAAELSLRNQSLLGLFSAEIETAADKVILESPSAATRRHALVWKTEAIPVMQTSLLRTDPLAAALDAWVFILQMKAYMEQPTVKEGWGDFQPLIVGTLNRMAAEVKQRLQAAAPSANMASIEQQLSSWAEAHPIQLGLASRESMDAELLRRTEQSELGARGSLRAIEESMGDLTARLDAYNAYLPKQARWQAELLLSDLARNPQVSQTMSNIADLSATLAKTSGSMEQLPQLASDLRKAALADVESQRLAGQSFLREERVQAFEELNQQRIETLAELRRERLAATEDLRNERQIILNAVHSNEEAFMRDVNATAAKMLADSDIQARGLIDHFFLRALELVLITLALCALVVWFFVRRAAVERRRRASYDRAA